jgi:NADPH:quinone reductase-like Zn-dependent oxidoreductase
MPSVVRKLTIITQAVITITGAALNHRDLFIRQHLYPGTTFGVPLLADGVGIVSSTGTSSSAKSWLNKRVLLNPGTGWKDSLEGPEHPKGYAIMGGTKSNPAGTLQDVCVLDAGELEECPEHLSDEEAAALPLTGLTAWRAFWVKSGNAVAGRNILVTGIGGGVALMVLLFAVAQGCNVYVTSGNQEKIDKAVKLGAKGGVIYKEKDWDKKLQAMLPKDRQYLDAIVDGAGGDVVKVGSKILKVRSLPRSPFLRLSSNIATGWRHHLYLRHDRLPQDGFPHVRCVAQHRSPWLYHGLTERIRRYGTVREGEEDEACCQPKCAGSGY